MAGNVFEWVNDWYKNNYYAASPSENPKGPDTGQFRVVRGGGWLNSEAYVRSVNRYGNVSGDRGAHIGFRCLVSPGN